METDIFIASYDDVYRVEKFRIPDASKCIYYTKGFWDYFIKSHPLASQLIFANDQPLHDSNYLNPKDRVFSVSHIAWRNGETFEELLADSIGGLQKMPSGPIAFFSNSDDHTFNDQFVRDPKSSPVTPEMAKDFKRLKEILTGKDRSQEYVVVFRKAFINQVLSAPR